MSEKIQAMRKTLENRIKTARKIIATKEATIRRAELDLADLDSALSRIENGRKKRVSKGSGHHKVNEVKTPLKQNSGDSDKIEIPTVEMELPAPAAAAPGQEKKKSSWINPFN